MCPSNFTEYLLTHCPGSASFSHRGIMHDEAVYSDPLTFKPERFLPASAGGLGEPDCAPAVFGYGRRICPGMHLAEASLWMYAARMLAVLDIKPVQGEDGEELPPRAEPGPGVIW